MDSVITVPGADRSTQQAKFGSAVGSPPSDESPDEAHNAKWKH